MSPRRAAMCRMSDLANAWGDLRIDPVRDADMRTSMNDARTALCIARGVDLDDIDPASGHDYSRRAYESVRRSWLDLIAQEGRTEHVEEKLREARAKWAERRPEWVEGDPWFTESDHELTA